MATAVPLDARGAEHQLRSRRRLVTALAMLGAVVVGVSIAQLFLGSALAVAAICALAVLVIVWMAPWTGIIVLVIGAALIEQFPLLAEGAYSDGTDRILFFQSLNATAGLGGIYATPFELFLVLLLTVWLIKGFATRTLALPRSPLSRAVAVFGLLVALGWVRGVTSGGSFTDSLLELRPWLYLVIAYFVSSQLLTSKKHLQVALWVLMIGIGLKGIQGVFSLATHYNSRPQAILAHEESFFFGLFIAVLAGLWLLPIKGRLRTAMTLLFPFVLAADIANQRRTAWAITGAALLAVFILCYVGLPERRRAIASFAAVGCVLAGVYWVGFSNNPGLLGQPARAVLSQLAPSSRDQQSNQYRTVENVNLGVAIRQTMPFGMGFGHPIPQQVPNVDVSNVDSFITYLPHNGVLYVWLRLGLAGIVLFWLLIGIGIMMALNTFRERRSELAVLISVTLVVALVAYVMQGFFDMGLYWFRIAIAVGFLMGALEAIRRFDKDPAPSRDPLLTSQAPARAVAIAKRHAA